MPAATTKSDLIAVTAREYERLVRLIADIPVETALRKVDDDTSIKDIVAHRAHWIDLFLGWVAAARAGERVHLPAKGYNWSELRAYNRALRKRQATLGWADAKAGLAEAHARLARFIDETDEAELYVAGRHPWTGKWTLGRYAEASGASHYRSAAKAVRNWTRKIARGSPAT